MPPKDRAPKRPAPGQANAAGHGQKQWIDYHRPFYQKALRREEIQEDLALIQSSMKRDRHAPSRYQTQGNSPVPHQQQPVIYYPQGVLTR
eukprot:CAMPEP_0202865832 /NCGR_PEP_ID=MMETSP1391-20130828/6503_1 /ASSEMBLY_ACC=CAM_ASM_000867 /TAXON_ID=1034604 /ORGANISM="Chlamydomonas leiostraca, Strain SAG 11-49" /LENGTH=89 /DNA_ID=CAMNT_0049545713 /DNA_START=14 /DNA_END=283 /DNA_ORIENTATION=+